MLAASFHYFHHPPRTFAGALRALRRLGADTVDSPVPWSRHAPDGDAPRFDREDAHLLAFLDAAAAEGLDVHLRLGPAVGAQLTGLGLPSAVAADRSLAALRADGRPQVVPAPPRGLWLPSYAAAGYRARAEAWIRDACAALRPFAGDAGPVRTLVLGDVWPFLGRNAAASPDHHPEALAAWSRLRATLGRAHEPAVPESPSHAADGNPAAGRARAEFSELLYLEFLEGLTRAAALELGGSRRLAGLLPPAGLFPPVGVGRLTSRFPRLGIDAWATGGSPQPLERLALLVAGTALEPYAACVPAGSPPYLPPESPADLLRRLVAFLATGFRGLVLSMGVARDRWVGGLLNAAFEAGDEGRAVEPLLHGVRRSGWLGLSRRARAAVVVPRDLVRASLAALGGLAGPAAPGLAAAAGVSISPLVEAAEPALGPAWRWLEAAERSLHDLGVPYVLVDDEGPVLPDVPLVLVPLGPAGPRAEAVAEFLRRGAVVLAGPASFPEGAELPGLEITAEPGPGAVRTSLERLAAPTPPRPAAEPGVERADFHDAAGTIAGLALTNRSGRPLPLARALGQGDWRDLDEPGPSRAAGQLEPRGVRLLVPLLRREGAP